VSSPNPSPTKVVVAVDGSSCSEQALRWAARQASISGGELHAVTAWHFPNTYGSAIVMDDGDWAENGRMVLEQALTETLGPAEADSVQRHVLQGHPAQVLLDQAADADLLVVGSRGHGGFAGMLLGSVSQHVVAHAPCPVVVVHGDRLPSTEPASGSAARSPSGD
jgi:nucleotide-binding universal stress UspA family protein